MQKPSEKVLSNPFDGKEIMDKGGRKIRLRKPNILDRYDLFSALEDDAKNPMCLSYALPMLHVMSIDGVIMESARSIKEFRANLVRLADEGLEAVLEYLNEVNANSIEQEETDKAKK
ncbi:MAG TPA: hypothetical protein VGW78_07480 [Candidatus Babeliales bacterium]|jgi:uncharacterized tellurite resistance protein B-like protein|nr:hypothetical protein [Candidatus Babeliales bacterium]